MMMIITTTTNNNTTTTARARVYFGQLGGRRHGETCVGDNSVDQNYQYNDYDCFHDNTDDHDYCINFRDHHQVGAWKGKQVPGDQ